MHESNPMMGLRGIRLSIVMPEIVEMQVRAIFEAAANATLKGVHAKPEVMIPLTGHVNELKQIQPRLDRDRQGSHGREESQIRLQIRHHDRNPARRCYRRRNRQVAEFFSFGTNDLTQMTFGYSRDDAERNFLVKYVEDGILPKNPFQTIDRDGVGRLMQMAVKTAAKPAPTWKLVSAVSTVATPNSIEFCHLIGNNYVSCSPFRVPVARLAAAHAALKHSSGAVNTDL